MGGEEFPDPSSNTDLGAPSEVDTLRLAGIGIAEAIEFEAEVNDVGTP